MKNEWCMVFYQSTFGCVDNTSDPASNRNFDQSKAKPCKNETKPAEPQYEVTQTDVDRVAGVKNDARYMSLKKL
jgi:hypothetical protein